MSLGKQREGQAVSRLKVFSRGLFNYKATTINNNILYLGVFSEQNTSMYMFSKPHNKPGARHYYF